MIRNNIISDNTDVLMNAEKLFSEALGLFEDEKYSECLVNITQAHKLYLSADSTKNISICLSFIGLLKYLLDSKTYYKSLLILEDAKFLAQSVLSEPASGINRFAFSQVMLKENNYSEALLYLTRAASMLQEYPYIQLRVYETLAFIYTEIKDYEKAYHFIDIAIKAAKEKNFESCLCRLNKIYNKLQESNEAIFNKALESTQDKETQTQISKDPLIALLKIARTISAEINMDVLLKTIAEQTKLALNADRCTVFLWDKETDELWSKVALGMDSEEIRFPIDKGLAGHVAKTGQTINIKNAYNDSRFNKDIDAHTGYKTNNILCMPIRNIKFEIIGVFQVLNKYDGDFTSHDEDLLLTIGSNAGIALENTRLFNTQQKMLDEQKQLFSSFIDTLSASIDARDKITSGHSLRVKMYAKNISKALNFTPRQIESIEQAAMLHDIGKIGIRDSVLQKEGALTSEEYDHIKEHVIITHDILSKIYASKAFEDVIEIAASHHEKVDGSGYFRKLYGKDIPLGGRILAVADVFDAITSKRHYRDKMPITDALDILLNGVGKHFDKKIVDTFMSMPCDELIDIFLTEYNCCFNPEHREILKNYSIYDLYNLIKSDSKTDSQNELVNIFQEYYTNKSKEQN